MSKLFLAIRNYELIWSLSLKAPVTYTLPTSSSLLVIIRAGEADLLGDGIVRERSQEFFLSALLLEDMGNKQVKLLSLPEQVCTSPFLSSLAVPKVLS